MDRLCQEYGIDAARTRSGQNIGQDAQPQLVLLLHGFEHLEIDLLDSAAECLRGMERPARPGQLPDFLGDAVHIDRQAHPAVADQCDPEFFLPHRSQCGDDSAG